MGRNAPTIVKLEPGTHHWCRCGKSAKVAFCDGAHAGTDTTPVALVVQEKKTVALCGCQRTHDPPFCDGHHVPPKKEPEVKVNMRREPYLLIMKPGTYHWCSCGGTKTPPFCDGTTRGPSSSR